MLNRVLGLLVLSSCLYACATSGNVCRRDPITGTEQCAPESNNYGEAAVGAGAAAGAWVAVGCTLNGCQAPDRCNPKTKLCESTHCTQDSDCGPAFHCDAASNRCQ